MKNEKLGLRKPKPGMTPEVIEVPVPEKKKQTFRDYIEDKRKRSGFKYPVSYLNKLDKTDKERGRDWLSLKAIAFCLGMKYETCRKLINQDKGKGKDHRDFVIALSIVLDMNVAETNEALELFYDTPKLHEESERDACLISIIDENRLRSGRDNADDPYNNSQKKLAPIPLDKKVEFANSILQSSSHDRLDIIRPRTLKKRAAISAGEKSKCMTEKKPIEGSTDIHATISLVSPYKKVSPIYIGNEVYPNIYNDLESEYSLWRYSACAKMIVSDGSGEKKYTLSADSNGKLECDAHQSDNGLDRHSTYDSLDDSGDFSPFFLELSSAAQRGWERLLIHLNDTRNYYERLGAGISGDSIHVFVERYNYRFSERNQFFLTEYVNGEFRFSIFRSSVFMAMNLGEQEYAKYYRKEVPSPLFVFQTEEDFTKSRCEQFLSVYNQMKNRIEEILGKLKSKSLYIRDIYEIWDNNPERVCSWFNVEKQFKCRNRYFIDKYEETYLVP